MPGRIFSQLRIPTPQLDKALTAKNPSTVSVAEIGGPTMDNLKRPGGLAQLAKRHGSSERKDKEKDKDRSSSKDAQSKNKDSRDAARNSPVPAPLRLGMYMESPPNLLIGSPHQSTGLLLSGRLQVTPNRQEVIVEDLVMFLECTTTSKRPVQDRCRECATRVVDLYEWKFLSKPKIFSTVDGMQELPFSHLVPGHLPTTTHGCLGTIDYSLHVRARTSDNQTIEFRREIELKRALIPGADKNSVRIFPPTDLTLHVTLPNIVHPIGEFPVQCRMTGISSKPNPSSKDKDDSSSSTRWRLRKLTWRVEEHESAISPACTKHAPKVGGEGKGIQHEHTRELASDELKQGWKTDFDADSGAGVVEGEFMAHIDSGSKPQTSVDAPAHSTGSQLKISHHLVLELVIAEEWAPSKKPNSVTPTGAARVLRTQFHLNLTQRAGMGISWDDEMPPTYEDVPASPPRYLGGNAPHTRVEFIEPGDVDVDGNFSLGN